MSIYTQIYDLISHYVYADTLDTYAELVCTQTSTLLCILAVSAPILVILIAIRRILDI